MKQEQHPATTIHALRPNITETSKQVTTGLPSARGPRPIREYVNDYFHTHFPGLKQRLHPRKIRKTFISNRLRLIALAGCLLASVAQSADVAPFGFALGKTTRSQVEAGMKGKVELKTLGTNKYSLGPMLSAPGEGLQLEGLNEVLFVFDRNETLVAVQMTFDKGFSFGRFGKLYEYLRNKYPVTRQSIPHVGDSWAHFRQGDSIIELDSPHMGFNVTVLYMTRDFERRFRTVLNEERKGKKQREASQF